MNSFLGEVAQQLYAKYGTQISNLTIVFPNRRATRFFAQELAQVVEQPIWQPKFASIDDLVRQLTSLEVAHELTLIDELYRQYNLCFTHSKESFDLFYSWGKLLLSDFDTIDKYMIDPALLYSNMSDLRELEDLLGDEFPEKELILNFWRRVKTNQRERSQHFATFDNIWSTLNQLYVAYRTALIEQGIGYSGMIYRQAAQLGNEDRLEGDDHYVFVGFNALNRCEQIILERLKEAERAEFFWDGDSYFVNNKSEEAGLFLRRNIAKFSPEYHAPSHFGQPKNIEVIKAPNDIMQCKSVERALQKILDADKTIDQRTAIVLTDESLLPILTYSLPSHIEDINITMGASLTQSAPYLFFERVVSLERNRTDAGYYLEDILSLLSHPYIGRNCDCANLLSKIQELKNIYFTTTEILNQSHLDDPTREKLSLLFDTSHNRPVSIELIDRYQLILDNFAHNTSDDDKSSVDNNEFTLALKSNLAQLKEVISKNKEEISISLLHSLLGKVNANTRIPYDGDPLKGLQIMGILESRTLDFENIIILSLSDENFPGNRATNSFIPVNLRRGFGLPTIVESGAMWSYYFYRLISRAKNITLVYSTSQQDSATGEQSRFIYQLEYESPHQIKHVGVDLQVQSHKAAEPIEITKDPQMISTLAAIRYSPSSIRCYINCPMQFYFERIAKIPQQRDYTLEIEPSQNGSILHWAIEDLYKPLIPSKYGGAATEVWLNREALQEYLDDDSTIIESIEKATKEILGSRAEVDQMRVSINHMSQLVLQQIRNIITIDINDRSLSSIAKLESPLEYQLSLDNNRQINIRGIADRIDILNDKKIRIIDYKSGDADHSFDGLDSLFSTNDKEDPSKYHAPNGSALQGLIYWLCHSGARVGIYSLRRFSKGDMEIYLYDKEQEREVGEMSAEYKERFEQNLKDLFSEILDPNRPFVQSRHIESCTYCPYTTICQRTVVKKW